MDTTIDALAVRPLEPRDLDDVVAIDAAIEGHSRRVYFENRLAAARRQPAQHAQFAVLDDEGRLAGHLLARVLEGEFGYTEPRLRLEAVGVRPDARRSGAGRRLFAALVEAARQRDIDELHTLASWRDHAMLQWLDALGFALAPAQVLDCAVAGGAYAPERDDTLDAAPEAASEIDYGASAVAGNDFERLARDVADVRTMAAADLPEIVRVDRDIVGRPRERYMRHLLEEALADSSLRISLTAHADGALAGYLMARADRGDFGRTEPVAVLDTLGVAPGYAGRGIGHALISQLFVNLGALRIERVETVVAPRDFALLGFLQDVGFAPSSQRLAFRYRIRRPQ
jgi:ribosomal protein S18 acetylase RimI-like enzyme